MSEQALAVQQRTMTEDQVALVKRTICKGSTDDELKLFIATAERLALDPFGRQIFAVKRWDSSEGRAVMAIQVSIDGFRCVAQRSHELDGQLGPFWCGQDGKWVDVWLAKEPPAAAKVGVLRRGCREPFWGVARFAAYSQTKKGGELNIMWAKMPDVMIAKCAESLALRKAFPAELSGLYTPDEMGQADSEPARPVELAPVLPPRKVTVTMQSAATQSLMADPLKTIGEVLDGDDLPGNLGSAPQRDDKRLEHELRASTFVAAIAKWKHTAHATNWVDKHRSEVNALPADLIAVVKRAKDEKLRELAGKEALSSPPHDDGEAPAP